MLAVSLLQAFIQLILDMSTNRILDAVWKTLMLEMLIEIGSVVGMNSAGSYPIKQYDGALAGTLML